MLKEGDGSIRPLKTTIVGAASITWMPTFFNDLTRCDAMRGGVLTLHDIDANGVEDMRAFGEKLALERGFDLTVTVVSDLAEALAGSDFVVCTVLVGSHALWKDEMDTIIRHGVPHPKGMSVGPGGFGMGIRQIPWIVALARMMERVCPRAWLLNYSNPMQSITYAVQKHTRIKTIGLCHGVTHTVGKLADQIGLREDELFYKIGGVNHFEMITALSKDGVDLLPEAAKAFETREREQGGTNEKTTTEIYRLFGAYPCNEDIHAMEFSPYYIHKNSRLEDYDQKQNLIEMRIRGREEAWSKVRAYLKGDATIGQVVDNGSEKLAEIIDGISANKPVYLYANVLNDGYVGNLDRDMCVEVPVVVFADGYIGCAIGDLPRPAAVMTNIHGAVQHYTEKAAMTGSRADALTALALDPMCYSLTAAEREHLLDDLLQVAKGWLPGYWF